jgi:hypothetical protein
VEQVPAFPRAECPWFVFALKSVFTMIALKSEHKNTSYRQLTDCLSRAYRLSQQKVGKTIAGYETDRQQLYALDESIIAHLEVKV